MGYYSTERRMPSVAESLRRWRKKNLNPCPESLTTTVVEQPLVMDLLALTLDGLLFYGRVRQQLRRKAASLVGVELMEVGRRCHCGISCQTPPRIKMT
jgi:hypothetical protein